MGRNLSFRKVAPRALATAAAAVLFKANGLAVGFFGAKPGVISFWLYLTRPGESLLWRVKLHAYRLGVSAEAARVRLKEVGLDPR